MTTDYKNSVFLPKTTFSMKANLAEREKEFIEFWDRIDIYKKIRESSKGKKKFVLHFGPPFANGHLHIGHALTYILKDITNKLYQMSGYDAPLIAGWDCHGLPIEIKIEEYFKTQGKKKEEVPVLDYIKACRDFANKWIDIQAAELKRFGLITDWKRPYKTMDFESEASIIEELFKFLKSGSLYKGLKPVLWSVVEKTALAEAEVEYKEHQSDAIFVAFKIYKSNVESLKNANAIIWTTTPWTLPGNRAISYGKDHVYIIIEALEDLEKIKKNQRFLIAKDLAKNVLENLGVTEYKIIQEIKGEQLKETICHHPWYGQEYDFDVPMIAGDHVTTEAGTGLVHTAPAHGIEDFIVCKEYGIEVPETVQGDGTYYNHVPIFANQHIFKVNSHILSELDKIGALLKASKLLHSYPHSWRSKAPLIYRATSQWFISMESNDLKKKALKAIKEVEWFPKQGKNRITGMIENRPDWCLSRQRTWGVPIALFVNKKTGTPLIDEEVFERIVSQIKQEGIGAWHSHSADFYLGEKYNSEDFEKVNDIIDVWFESACTNSFVLEKREELAWPADMYFEGSDQHRGWFHTSLLHACGTKGIPPYRKVLTHGFVLDEKGLKMSKSVGNTVSPQEVINTMGADILRLWVACSDYTDDIRIGKGILKHAEDIYRRLRNTLRYLLGALAAEEYEKKNEVDYEKMPELEKWVLHKLNEIDQLQQKVLQNYDFASFYNEIHNFCTNDLSAFYFDIRKDVLYCDDINSETRKSTIAVMRYILERLVKWIAPVLSFTAEEAWQVFTKDSNTSIHLQNYCPAIEEWRNDKISEKFQELRKVRRVLTSAIELERAAKTIGSSLQSKVILYINSEWGQRLDNIDWAEIAIASQVFIVHSQVPTNAYTTDDLKGIGAVVELADGNKCERCWKILPEVGNQTHNDLCKRCDGVISASAN